MESRYWQKIPAEELPIIPALALDDTGEGIIVTIQSDDIANGCPFFERLYYQTKSTEYVLTKKLEPCCRCGTLTNRIDICTESFFCSKKCQKEFDDEFMIWCEEHPLKEERNEKSS